jgi:hypothetical protein
MANSVTIDHVFSNHGLNNNIKKKKNSNTDHIFEHPWYHYTFSIIIAIWKKLLDHEIQIIKMGVEFQRQ